MQQRVAESAVGAGPMATLTELRDVDAPNGARSRIEPWMRVPLRWADPASRSLLLQALAISGVLVSYGLTLLLGPPPALGALAALKGLAVALLLLAALVAPVSGMYRLLACWCIVLSAMGTTAWVLLESSELFGATTYGTLDAAEIGAYGAWVIAYLLLRMRHPLTILVTTATYCIAAVSLCVRVMPQVRLALQEQAPETLALVDERTIVGDDVLLRSALLVVGFGLVALAWWIDGWFRQMLPVRATESLLDADDTDAVTEARRARRLGWIWCACLVDPVAIVYAHIALRHARSEGVTPHDEFMTRALLGLAYGRLTLVLLLLTTLAVVGLEPEWRV